ncbi:MAG: pilus assembly protein [Legionellales bacterium]|nr:pilus assembly protein [Legionellales bacterium]|tara:strand:- start:1140 stop:1565 length:426 start_codon:yes stop_codon:yes gene_type:complete
MQAYKKAFTLTELMATLAIVAILAAVGIPSYLSYTKKARFSEVISATTAVKVSIEHCYNTIGSFVGCNNDKFGIPPAVVNGENAVQSLVVENGKITVTPNPNHGLKITDLYILTPSIGNDHMIQWKASGEGAEQYAITDKN